MAEEFGSGWHSPQVCGTQGLFFHCCCWDAFACITKDVFNPARGVEWRRFARSPAFLMTIPARNKKECVVTWMIWLENQNILLSHFSAIDWKAHSTSNIVWSERYAYCTIVSNCGENQAPLRLLGCTFASQLNSIVPGFPLTLFQTVSYSTFH